MIVFERGFGHGTGDLIVEARFSRTPAPPASRMLEPDAEDGPLMYAARIQVDRIHVQIDGLSVPIVLHPGERLEIRAREVKP